MYKSVVKKYQILGLPKHEMARTKVVVHHKRCEDLPGTSGITP